MRKLIGHLASLPLKQRILAITYLTAIAVAACGIPLLAIGVTSHHGWMKVVGVALLVSLLVENAIISPIIRVRASSRRTEPPA